MENSGNQAQKIRRTFVPQGETFTAVTLIVCLVLVLAAWVFVALPLAVAWLDVVLKFWGLR